MRRACVPGSARRIRLRILFLVLLVIIGLAALSFGSYLIEAPKVFEILIGRGSGMPRSIVLEWRLPRVLASLFFGAALAVSGAIFQSLTRNPLASPDVIGFSAGSHTGAILVIVLAGHSFIGIVYGAIGGGLITAILVYAFSYRRGIRPFRLIIIGIGFSVMLSSLNTWILLRAEEEKAAAATVWGAGTLNATKWQEFTIASAVILALFVLVALLTPSLRQLELGDDAARAAGVSVEGARLGLVVVAVALTAIVTATAGPIAFISLSAPQISRRLIGTGGIPILGSALIGAILLSAADVVAEHAFPRAVPVGVVTVVIGGAYLVWLIAQEGRARHASLDRIGR